MHRLPGRSVRRGSVVSSVYYNEFDPRAAAWLRELIKAGAIADGEVDERSIEDIFPADLRGFTRCHFFAGIGVWEYALACARWPSDRVVWTGSCPCQPFSESGQGTGFTDERHLWPAWFHLIEICRPETIFGEQVASPDGLNWLDLVLSDLEGTDYAATAFDLCAASAGAPHRRQRLYFVADSLCKRRRQGGTEREIATDKTDAPLLGSTAPKHSAIDFVPPPRNRHAGSLRPRARQRVLAARCLGGMRRSGAHQLPPN